MNYATYEWTRTCGDPDDPQELDYKVDLEYSVALAEPDVGLMHQPGIDEIQATSIEPDSAEALKAFNDELDERKDLFDRVVAKLGSSIADERDPDDWRDEMIEQCAEREDRDEREWHEESERQAMDRCMPGRDRRND